MPEENADTQDEDDKLNERDSHLDLAREDSNNWGNVHRGLFFLGQIFSSFLVIVSRGADGAVGVSACAEICGQGTYER